MTDHTEGTVIARRELRDVRTGDLHTILLYAPTLDPDHAPEWVCRAEIHSPEGIKTFGNPGSDALAALVLAISSLRFGIKQLGIHRLSWLGQEGWVGLPIVVPDSDEGFLAIVEGLIQTELARQAAWQKELRSK